MSRYVDIYCKVRVPFRSYKKWVDTPKGLLSKNPPENIKDIIEFKLQGLNPNITVTVESTQEV